MALYSHGDLPGEWIGMNQGKGNLLHFCFLHCLYEWVEKQMPVVEEVPLKNYFEEVPKSGTQFDNEYMGKFVEEVNPDDPIRGKDRLLEVDREAVNEYWRDL